MSSTDSCVVKAPRAGPMSSAHCSKRCAEALAADRFFERGAAERVRGAGAALVEHQQVARAQRGRDRLGDEFAERQRCLPGAAGERDHRVAAGRGSGELALDAQRDRAREQRPCGRAARAACVQAKPGELGQLTKPRLVAAGDAGAAAAQRGRGEHGREDPDRRSPRHGRPTIAAAAPRSRRFPPARACAVGCAHGRRARDRERPGAPAAIGPYSHAVRAAGCCSAQVRSRWTRQTGEIVGDTAAEQARRCLENLAAVCAAAGTSLSARCASPST